MAKLLIIDDEAHIARVLVLWLKRHHHEVLEACNGMEALDILRKQPVDMIISDMNMPVLDGLAMVKKVRTELHLDMPILLLSARCDQSNLAEKLAPYRARLLPKPFVPSRLMADIEETLALAQVAGKDG